MSVLAQLNGRMILSLSSKPHEHALFLINGIDYLPYQTYPWYVANSIYNTFWTPIDGISLAERCTDLLLAF